jgi:hypothetical protein
MFDWIFSNREAFLGNYVEIGRNHLEAKTLQEEHNQFTIASNVSQILINLVDQSTVISRVGIRIQWVPWIRTPGSNLDRKANKDPSPPKKNLCEEILF